MLTRYQDRIDATRLSSGARRKIPTLPNLDFSSLTMKAASDPQSRIFESLLSAALTKAIAQRFC